MAKERKQRAFTALQPTGDLHLGNYLGAIVPWVRQQHQFEGLLAVADLHALTSLPAPDELARRTWSTAALCVAAGIDPQTTTLFIQSHVPEHAELSWILSCVCPSGWLTRMIQFRQRARDAEKAGAGVLSYPVLMASDILLYRAEIVPIGDDQKQHLELCRGLVRRFHTIYGETFAMPAASTSLLGARVMGLDEPSHKMSKSATGEFHRIALLDDPDRIRKIIARATTDSESEVGFDPERRPGISNLVTIAAALSNVSPDAIVSRYRGRGYGHFKHELADQIIDVVHPIQNKYRALMGDRGAFASVLRDGAERARAMAAETLHRVRERVGLHARLQ